MKRSGTSQENIYKWVYSYKHENHSSCNFIETKFFLGHFTAHKKNKFSIKYFFSKWDQIQSFLRIWSHLLKKSFMKNFIFSADFLTSTYLSRKLKIAGI